MLARGERNLLFAGGRHIGYLEYTDNHPASHHFFAKFTPTEAFEAVREIFERYGVSEEELVTWKDPVVYRRGMERREAAYQRMNALDLRIVDPSGNEEALTSFVLDGDRAVLRPGCFRRLDPDA